MIVDSPGIYPLDEAAYHADPCPEPSLSCSVAHLLVTRSPAHARAAHPRLNPDLEERHADHFDRGAALHAMLLGGNLPFLVVDAADWRTKAARESKAEAREAGQIPLLAKDHEELSRIHDRLLTRPAVRAVIEAPEAVAENVVVWREGATWARCRPDIVVDGALVDVKLTGVPATPDQWARRTAFSLGYDFRAAFYLRGWRAVTGADMAYRFLVVESAPPYEAALFEMTPGAIELASRGVDRAFALWSECLRTGRWPGYPETVHLIHPPAWAEERWQDDDGKEPHPSADALDAMLEMYAPLEVA